MRVFEFQDTLKIYSKFLKSAVQFEAELNIALFALLLIFESFEYWHTLQFLSSSCLHFLIVESQIQFMQYHNTQEGVSHWPLK